MPPKRRRPAATDEAQGDPPQTRTATVSERLPPLPAKHSTSYGSPAPVLPHASSHAYGADLRAATRDIFASVRKDNRKASVAEPAQPQPEEASNAPPAKKRAVAATPAKGKSTKKQAAAADVASPAATAAGEDVRAQKRRKGEEEKRLKDEEQKRLKAEEQKRLKAEEQKRLQNEEQKRLKDEEQKRLKDEEQKRLKDEEQKRRKDEEQKRRKDEEQKRRKDEEQKRLEDEAQKRLEDEEVRRFQLQAAKVQAQARLIPESAAAAPAALMSGAIPSSSRFTAATADRWRAPFYNEQAQEQQEQAQKQQEQARKQQEEEEARRARKAAADALARSVEKERRERAERNRQEHAEQAAQARRELEEQDRELMERVEHTTRRGLEDMEERERKRQEQVEQAEQGRRRRLDEQERRAAANPGIRASRPAAPKRVLDKDEFMDDIFGANKRQKRNDQTPAAATRNPRNTAAMSARSFVEESDVFKDADVQTPAPSSAMGDTPSRPAAAAKSGGRAVPLPPSAEPSADEWPVSPVAARAPARAPEDNRPDFMRGSVALDNSLRNAAARSDAARDALRDMARTGTREAARPATREAARPATREAARPATREGLRPVSREGLRPASREAQRTPPREAQRPAAARTPRDAIRTSTHPPGRSGQASTATAGQTPRRSTRLLEDRRQALAGPSRAAPGFDDPGDGDASSSDEGGNGPPDNRPPPRDNRPGRRDSEPPENPDDRPQGGDAPSSRAGSGAPHEGSSLLGNQLLDQIRAAWAKFDRYLSPYWHLLRYFAYLIPVIFLLGVWYRAAGMGSYNTRVRVSPVSNGLEWYGWTHMGKNIGQFVPYSLRHPLGFLADEEYTALRRSVDSHDARLVKLTEAQKDLGAATQKLENILPKVVSVKQDKKTSKLVIQQDFWHALRDVIHDEKSILTLQAKKDGSNDISDEHWSALLKRMETEGVPTKSWDEWVKNNRDKVDKIVGGSAGGESLSSDTEKKLLSEADKLIREKLSSSGLRDIVVTKEEFIREVKKHISVHKREIQAESAAVHARLRAMEHDAGMTRSEVDAIVRRAISNARLEAAAKGSIQNDFETVLSRRVNYFAVGNGAQVDIAATSPTYNPRLPEQDRKKWFGLPSWFAAPHKYTPRFETSQNGALMDWEDAGHCWCGGAKLDNFTSTSPVDLSIRLAKHVIPENLVVEYIDPGATLDPKAMPKDIEVWGLVDVYPDRHRAWEFMWAHFATMERGHPLLEKGFIKLGQFVYEHNGASAKGVQVFRLSEELGTLKVHADQFIIRAVTNQGADDHTCFYRLRMYGKEG